MTNPKLMYSSIIDNGLRVTSISDQSLFVSCLADLGQKSSVGCSAQTPSNYYIKLDRQSIQQALRSSGCWPLKQVTYLKLSKKYLLLQDEQLIK